MDKEKKLFREHWAYPVVFMIIITSIFIGILATFYQLTLSRVELYQETELKKMVLNTFNLEDNNVEENFKRYISIIQKDDLKYYVAKKDNTFLGYCFPISGGGLWGTIYALISITPDFSQVINLEIVEQNETPGLGGRISEEWFKKQFQKKTLFVDNDLQRFTLVAESEAAKSDEINQITGATASSKAVIDMIFKNIQKYEKLVEAKL